MSATPFRNSGTALQAINKALTKLFLPCSSFATLVIVLGGCNDPQSTLEGHGPAATRIAQLSWFMTILFLVISFVMWLLIGIGFRKRRGTLAEHAPIDARGGEMWIAVGGILVPFIVLTVLFILGLILLNAFPIHGMHGVMAAEMPGMPMPGANPMQQPDILITGHQWWWEIQYLNSDMSKQFTTANELHIPAGRPVDIEVVAGDVMHSFWVPQLHGKVDLIPGVNNYIRIDAAQPGIYEGQCAEYCGAEHARMRLVAVVQPPEEYAAWVQQQLLPAADPKTPAGLAGEQTFLAGPCSLCHTVRGTTAGGRVAPDLTHFGSRLFLAANSYPNNNGYLEAWITHAQSLKPAAQMPDLTQFNGTQLQGLVAYLSQLQ